MVISVDDDGSGSGCDEGGDDVDDNGSGTEPGCTMAFATGSSWIGGGRNIEPRSEVVDMLCKIGSDDVGGE